MLLEQIKDYEIFRPKCDSTKEVLHLLKAFEAGADAVFVAGCHEGE